MSIPSQPGIDKSHDSDTPVEGSANAGKTVPADDNAGSTGSAATYGRLLGKLIWPAIALLLLLLYNLVFTPSFFHVEIRDGRLFGSLVDVLNRAAPVMLIALGMTLIISTGGVDLSVGSVMAISGTTAAICLTQGTRLPFPPVWLAVIAPLLITLVLGAWNGLLVGYIGLQPIVATLILMVAGRGIAQLMSDGQIISFSNPTFDFIGRGYLFALPFAVSLVAGCGIGFYVLTRLTALGLFIEAAGGNETATSYCGVNTRAVKLTAYALCGLMSGAAGLVAASNLGSADASNTGMYLELDAILAVVLGGTSLTGGRFYLGGTLLGALLIQTLTTTILSKGVPVEYTLVVKALVVIAVCLLQSEKFRLWVTRPFRRAVTQ